MKQCQIDGCDKPQRHTIKDGNRVIDRFCNLHQPNANLKGRQVWIKTDAGHYAPYREVGT